MPPILLLVLSLLPLALAPWAARVFRGSSASLVALDAFVAVTIAGVAVGHILPEAAHVIGAWAVVVAIVGFLVPIGLHHGMHRLESRMMPAMVTLVLAGLALHAIGDGAALVHDVEGHEHGHGHDVSDALLPLAVLLHRLPVALAIWWFARPLLGLPVAIGFLSAIGLATIAGFLAAAHWWDALTGVGLATLHAFVVGMLFHVLLGHHQPRHAGAPRVGPLLLGGTIGLAFLALTFVAMPHDEGPGWALQVPATLAVIAFALVSRMGRRHRH